MGHLCNAVAAINRFVPWVARR